VHIILGQPQLPGCIIDLGAFDLMMAVGVLGELTIELKLSIL
jgi:hypothetical protein